MIAERPAPITGRIITNTPNCSPYSGSFVTVFAPLGV